VLYKTPYIRSRIVDGLAVVLDLRQGEYVILNKVATAMWRALLTTESEDRLRTLEQRLEVPAQQLVADLDAFSQSCIERGFLTDQPAQSIERAASYGTPRHPLAVRAWWSLLATTRALASEGFSATYARYSQFAKPAADAEVAPALLQQAERAFAQAENFFIIHEAPRDCLPRSLALYRFMLSAGIPVDHCIGVMRFPFQSHAWVECQGRVLNDSAANTGFYAELARI
jgi:hypothetical protein